MKVKPWLFNILFKCLSLLSVGALIFATAPTVLAHPPEYLLDGRITNFIKNKIHYPNAPSNCTVGNGKSITLINEDDTQLTLEEVVISNITNNGCDVKGKLRIQLPGNNVTVDASGYIDQYDNFYTPYGSIGPISLNIAGFILSSQNSDFKKDTLRLTSPFFGAPPSLGGTSVPLLKPPKITSEGLEFEQTVSTNPIDIARDAGVKFPELKLKNGVKFAGLSGTLEINSTGFGISAEGQIGIPGMKPAFLEGDQACYIAASFGIFIDSQGRQVIEVRSSEATQPVPVLVTDDLVVNDGADQLNEGLPAGITASMRSDVVADECRAPEGCALPIPIPGTSNRACISEVGLGMGCSPGINLDGGSAGGTIWLTEVVGKFYFKDDDASVELSMTFEITPVVLEFLGSSAISIEGTGRLQYYPHLEMSIGAAVKLWVIEMASAKVAYSAKDGVEVQGQSYVGGGWRISGTVKVWGSGSTGYLHSFDGEPNATGAFKVYLGINKGEILDVCTPIPYVKYCWKTVWWWAWGWHSTQVRYPCGVGFWNQCVTVPPETIWLGGVGADMGKFTGDIWGLKGYVGFWTYRPGFFVNFATGETALGDMNHYQLVNSRQATQALARWQAAQRGELSPNTPLDTRFVFSDDAADANSIIIRAPNMVKEGDPVQLSPMAAAYRAAGSLRSATDAITKTHVLTKTNTAFVISTNKPITVSLITPDTTDLPADLRNTEITPDNYTTFSPTLKISYGQTMTYTEPVPDQARWRYVSALPIPLGPVDVKLDDQLVFNDVISYTSYTDLPTGTHTVEIIPQVGNSITATFEAVAGQDTTALLFAEGDTLNAKVLSDNNQPPGNVTQSKVRFVNLLSASDPVTLTMNDTPLIVDVPEGSVSPYQHPEAGAYTIEMDTDITNVTSTVDLPIGSVYTFIANDQIVISGTETITAVTLLTLQDAVQKVVTQTEYVVNQAPIGEWQVKLTGDITQTGWLLDVFGPANPPVLSDFTINPANLEAVEASLRVQSDYAPTHLSFFANPATITETIVYTTTEGITETAVAPIFQGAKVHSMSVANLDQLSGNQPITAQIDLSGFESGDYYLWVQVEDGISPAINQYAALKTRARSHGARTVRVADQHFSEQVLTEGAGVIHIDHTDWFMDHFATTTAITPELHIEVWDWEPCGDPPAADCEWVDGEWGRWVFADYMPLYYEWTPSDHPDTDSYIAYIDAVDSDVITQTQVFTLTDTLYQMYDENNEPTGGIVGSYGWRDVYPDEIYTLAIGAYDADTGMIDRSPPLTFEVPLGDFNLTGPETMVVLKPGAATTTRLISSMSEDLFYDIDLFMDLMNVPYEMDADFISLRGRASESVWISPRARLKPLSTTWANRQGFVKASRLSVDGGPTMRAALTNYEDEIGIVITSTPTLEPGYYTLNFAAYAGPITRTAHINIFVPDATMAGLHLTPGISQTIRPGQTLTYTHLLTNTSTQRDDVVLDVETQLGWDVALHVAGQTLETTRLPLPLGPGENTEVSLLVTAPDNAASDLIEHITLKATSSLSSAFSATAVDRAAVGLVPSFTFGPNRALTVTTNSQAVYSHTLANTSNGPLDFTFQHTSSQGWDVNYRPAFTLDSGQAATTWMTVSIPSGVANTISPVIDTTHFTATAAGLMQSVINVTTVYSPSPSAIYLPLIMRNP